jgi:hypothetical protein
MWTWPRSVVRYSSSIFSGMVQKHEICQDNWPVMQDQVQVIRVTGRIVTIYSF